MSDILKKLRELAYSDEAHSHPIYDEAADYIEQLEKDAARWQEARKYLAVEDIEAWYSEDWKGHVPSDLGNYEADKAIDTALSYSK